MIPLGGPLAAQGPVIPDFGEGSDCVVENRLFCPDWVRDNWSGTLQPALVEHVKLTIIAVAIGFLLSFGAALLTHRLHLFEKPLVVFAAIVYTIPSLALFQLLVPITGLTTATVEVALVGYTLLILYRNILEGLRSVPPDVLDERQVLQGPDQARVDPAPDDEQVHPPGAQVLAPGAPGLDRHRAVRTVELDRERAPPLVREEAEDLGRPDPGRHRYADGHLGAVGASRRHLFRHAWQGLSSSPVTLSSEAQVRARPSSPPPLTASARSATLAACSTS